jgi:queuine tRNA-ribosyltransferase
MRKKEIKTSHGSINTPAFMPDATYGSIQNVSFDSLSKTGINAIVTTTLHIEQKIDSNFVKTFGGIHKFIGWNKPILTDSGGFQVFSLIYRNNNKFNKITEAGCSFVDFKTNKYNFLTPEISQIIQDNLGSDIRLVLDIPIKEDSGPGFIAESLARNTRWAKRSKDEFLKLNNLSNADFDNPNIKRPLLGAIVQGGNNFDLRKQSAMELMEIGFDIYCFGGLPLRTKREWRDDLPEGFYDELLHYVAEILPKDKIRYAMGVGTPDDIKKAVSYGWDLFDTVLPTRNGRHGYLYVSKGQGDSQYDNYDVLHIKNKLYEYSDQPIDQNCNCSTCQQTTRGYLRYLLKNKMGVGYELASIHNLSFYNNFIEDIIKNEVVKII